jgi:glycosyltransferase involved in cell wall biosynthesis
MMAQRILLLAPSLAEFGGTERVVLSLATLLASPERQVFIATMDAPSASLKAATEVHRLGPLPQLPLAVRAVTYVLAAWRLRCLKRRLAIDLTISNLWRSDLVSAISGGPDRKIALCHINVLDNVANRLMVSFRPFVAAIYRRFDRVIAVNDDLALELKHLYRLSSASVAHIDNFVDRPEAVSRIPADGLQRFVWCGRLSPEKNVSGLLDAWSAFARSRSGVQLLLVGDGPLRGRVIDDAARLGLRIGRRLDDPEAQIVMAGEVADPASYMLGARALLLSSYAEGLPMVVLEAMSLGVPVLAADCKTGGVRAALLGDGRCNPDRARAEYTPAGALLPVPEASRPQSLDIWSETLASAAEDPAQWRGWRDGALARAAHFTSGVARSRWLTAISF